MGSISSGRWRKYSPRQALGHPLKYAHVERERRYLVRSLPEGIERVDEIEDAYIVGTRLRLRTMTRQGQVIRKLGHKVRQGTGPREVACTSIYLDQVEWDLLAALPAHRLHKRRHHVNRDGYVFAVDEFDDGQLLAEFDDGLKSPTDVPAWLDVIADVTDDEEWTGAGRAASQLQIAESDAGYRPHNSPK